MGHPLWPLFDLRLRTERLELRVPDDELLSSIAPLAAEPIHDPDYMPFKTPWTEAPAAERPRNLAQWIWRNRGALTVDEWSLTFAVLVDGEGVGFQDIGAKSFGLRRSVETGSWLTQARQGQGIGKEMRSAVLAFAFDGLGAVEARSSAFADNARSLGVSDALGYQRDGTDIYLRQGGTVDHIRLRMTLDDWRSRERPPVEIEGLDAVLPMLVGGTDESPG